MYILEIAHRVKLKEGPRVRELCKCILVLPHLVLAVLTEACLSSTQGLQWSHQLRRVKEPITYTVSSSQEQ